MLDERRAMIHLSTNGLLVLKVVSPTEVVRQNIEVLILQIEIRHRLARCCRWRYITLEPISVRIPAQKPLHGPKEIRNLRPGTKRFVDHKTCPLGIAARCATVLGARCGMVSPYRARKSVVLEANVLDRTQIPKGLRKSSRDVVASELK